MTRIYIFILFCTVILGNTNAQNTFYKQYQFALNTDDEDPRYMYTIDDTLRLITIRTVSTVGINFSLLDTNGSVISNIYHDDIYFLEEAIVYDENKEQFIIDGISRRDTTRKNCIFIMDKYGNLLDTKCNQYALPDDIANGDVDNALHMTKTNFGYVSSGGEFVENGRYGFLNIYDNDLNLTFSDTLSQFRNIGNIAYDGQGSINAIGLVRNSLTFIGYIDSMFFLKINQSGEVIKQVRIPHTEGTLQLNGHYPFITDTLTGESYLLDEYNYDDGSIAIPRMLKFDSFGNIMWEFNDWQTRPRLKTLNIYQRKNGDIIAHGVGIYADVITNLPSEAVEMVSIDQNGTFLWDRILYELMTIDQQIEKRYLFTRDITEDSEDNIYCNAIGFLNIAGASESKPFLIKLTNDGCFTNECKPVVNVGDYHKPNNLVTERNEIHIYNKDTGQSYRYTFINMSDIDLGGKLLKSNSMSGDSDWEDTERKALSWRYDASLSSKVVREYFDFSQGIPEIQSHWHYNFGYKMGDILELDHTFTSDVDYLEVIDVQDITLLDGRTKKQFTLECQNPDPDGDPYPLRTWIEDIGDIDDFLNTPYACSNPSNEVVTCFFSDGELIWRHPDYDFCTVATEDVIENINGVFPNPTHDVLKLDFSLDDYFIMDIYGQVHLSGKSMKKGKTIDVSNLISGSYMLGGSDDSGNNVILKFVKI